MRDVRSPVVAGQFYAGSKRALIEQIENCFIHPHGPGEVPEVREGPRKMIGLVSPHAGYPYSGPVAAHGFSHLAQDGKLGSVVILGPNHSGRGKEISIDSSESWKTPLGEVDIDDRLRETVLEGSEVAELDSAAHAREHSLEVQLPFLQYLFDDDFRILPICMRRQDIDMSRQLGGAIGEAASGKNILIVASTDLSHYEPMEVAKSRDGEIIEKMEALDWEGVTEMVSRENLSVCGYGPVSTAILASRKVKAKRTETFKYATSGDTAGPSGRVVGYCSIGIYK